MAAPPQIIAADFQVRAMANSFWLRKEITNVGGFAPFINTTGGARSKSEGLGWSVCRASSAGVEMASGGVFSSTATFAYGTWAADQASGLVMPARVSAAAILACWLMAGAVEGADSGESLMICGAGTALCSVNLLGAGLGAASPCGESGRT